MEEERLSIGQLARLSGLTVKAIRYYDRVGLLKPSLVEPTTGFRSYQPSQLALARRIQLLRSVDLPLDDVRRCLRAAPEGERKILGDHLKRLESRAAQVGLTIHRLYHLIDPEGEPTVNHGIELDADTQRQLAIQLFNAVWELLEKEDRTTSDDDRMVHAAHASRYHWGAVGRPENLARGEWQCSRVYAVLRRAEPSMHHARRVLEICQAHGIGDFDLAFAYEALARAHAVAGELEKARMMAERAVSAAESVADDEDRKLVLADLETIPGLPRFW